MRSEINKLQKVYKKRKSMPVVEAIGGKIQVSWKFSCEEDALNFVEAIRDICKIDKTKSNIVEDLSLEELKVLTEKLEQEIIEQKIHESRKDEE